MTLRSWLTHHTPTPARYPLAGVLRLAHKVTNATERAAQVAHGALRPSFWNLSQWLLRTSIGVDLKLPCPNCGKSTAKHEIEELKTYCFACSEWGQAPCGARAEPLS
jgi:hypothetical protein